MKTNKSLPLILVASAIVWCGLNLHAQSGPTITTQPASQTNLPGTTVIFSVAVSGTGPFTYQWQFNGTNLPNCIITTVAGNGTATYAGDGGAAINASLYNPYGVAFDAFGNLFIADTDNNRIRKVDTNGIITTVAGNGTANYAGDGGAATNASLVYPSGVAFDASGNLYIADSINGRIRKMDTNGIITTVAGNGSSGYSGDGGAATNASLYYPLGIAFDAFGNLFIADYGNSRIREVATNGIITTIAGNGTNSYSGDGGAATNASLYYSSGVACDTFGNLFIADYGNSRIRKVDTNGIITTVAGNGTNSYSGDGGAATNASLYYSSGVACDIFGNLFIADYDNNRIRMVATNGIITTVVGNGSATYAGDCSTATNASLSHPFGVACDASGNLFIADRNNERIRAVNFAGYPTNLTLLGVSSNNIGNYTVVVTNSYGSVTSAVATLTLATPAVITVQPTNQLVVAGSSPSFSVAASGSGPFGYEWYFAGTNLVQSGTNSTLALPGVSTTNAGNYTVVITNNYGSVTSQVATLTVVPSVITVQPASQIALAGSSPSFSVAAAGSGPFGYEWYFAGTNLLQSGTNNTLTLSNVSTNNTGNYTVVVTNNYGSVTSQVATLTVAFPPSVTIQPASQMNLPGTTVSFSVAVAGLGPFTYQWQFNGTNLPNNIITTVAGKSSSGYSGDGGAATNANLYYPSGVAFDAFGNLFIADTSNNRIRKVDTNGIITTVAGTNSSGYSGDGGAATNASLNSPNGVAFDAFGNLFIADTSNNRIRKVDTNGIITTVAGTNSSGYTGDGGAATNARLYRPYGVTFDVFGNLFIADHNNNRIRKVNTNGIITTVAGKSLLGYSGDGGAATNATLHYPSGVAFDASGNLYIADSSNERIRMVATNGIITTVAGNGSATYAGDGGTATNASLYYPEGVVCDAFGNLFIADTDNALIRRMDTNGLISTVAGNGSATYAGDGGTATNASLYYPFGMAFDASGNLYIADSSNDRIRKVLLFAGYPTFTLNNIGVTNVGNYTVVITSPYGSVTSAVVTLTVEAPPVITSQPASQLVVPGSSPSFSVAVIGSGPFDYEWYFAGTNLLQSGTNSTLMLSNVSTNNTGNYTVVVTNNYGSVTSQVATLTVPFPPSVTVQPASQTNLMGTTVNFSVTVAGVGPFTYQWQFNGSNLPNNIGIITTVAGKGTNSYSGDGGAATNANLYYPSGVAFDAFGNLFIADEYNNRIRKVGTNGIITTVAGNGTNSYSGDGGVAINASLDYPYGVACDVSGNLFIADTSNNRIRKVDTNGTITTVTGGGYAWPGDGGAATNASLRYPFGVACDTSGNLFIADTDNQRICKVATNGIITTVAGKGSSGYSGDGGVATNAYLYNPTGVACDASGNLYIADQYNSCIRKVDTNGIITTVAGNYNYSYSGDGGAATNANLRYPYGVACDAFGNLFIADQNNERIRKVDTNGIITTVAGNGSYNYSGDGGAATNASLRYPYGVAFDAAGNLYIADRLNERIRKVNFATYPTLTLTGVGVTNVGNYTVVITSPYGSVTSSVAALYMPPFITVQPFSQIAVVGSSPSFSVAAAGSGSFDYEWYFGGTNLIQSGTNSKLTLPNISTNNSGNYMVMVTNNYGSVTSQIATLTAALPPTMTIQPASQTNLAGTTMSFSVAVTGTGPFTYQWQLNGTNFPNNIITTVAGNGGTNGYSGDGGAATNASFNPWGIVFDAFGNLFIADRNNNRIRMVATNGIITTVAGNGPSFPAGSYSGDGGAATNANLNSPIGVACDAAGNFYIADRYNSCIRKVATNGIITTVTSFSQPFGAASDASGNLYFTGNYFYILKMATNGIITTVATNASLNGPGGLAFDSFGNMYIADQNNNRIRKVATNGIVTTVAGNGNAAYSGDGGAATNATLNGAWYVTFDASGNLYIADRYNQCIRMVNTNGIITTVAGNSNLGYSGDGGAATNASFHPVGIAFDASGNLFIADDSANVIREVWFAGNPTFTLNNVGATNAGNYSVVITSPYGSVTSSVAALYIPPYITTQPQNASVFLASNAAFSVIASGSGPLNYQWLFGGTNLSGATDSSYAISNAHPANAGSYSAIVTNIYGSVTSSTAGLTVTLPPIVPAFTQTNGSLDFGFTWGAISGVTYQVEYKTNLAQPDWINLGDPITTTNPAASVLDSVVTDPDRYYRVRLVQ